MSEHLQQMENKGDNILRRILSAPLDENPSQSEAWGESEGVSPMRRIRKCIADVFLICALHAGKITVSYETPPFHAS
ncbi:hypothetical protein IHQ71_23930 [Rhizobium sp. TH2]|uniref:hypothetical protein n=1 Tax=Rhizobium sp. TH2 TaxID=2775403 RepID=UPI002157666B|nr:hypothetical protein [Rhizobium sp. TH2]UVC08173.1 hypothetical protein IHQ71_23930 [Rhizobium sp. TH2]